MTLPPIDKTAHFLAGATIAALPTAYGVDPIIGFAVACALGILKEAYDSTGRGTPDINDAIATVAGAATVLPLVFAF